MTGFHMKILHKLYKPVPPGLSILFILLVLCIISAGYIYYRQYSQHLRSDAEKQLSVIAVLKANDIMQWRKERIGDGNVLYKNNPFTGLVKRFLTNKDDINARWRLTSWLNKIVTSYQYKQILLLDHNGKLRFMIPSVNSGEETHQIHHLSAILGSRNVTFLDFHRELPDSAIHLSIVVPIIDETNSLRTYGYVMMIIDPRTYLYPLIQRWPIPGSSAETYLIRREGNDVLFLNDLRFKDKTALKLRFPLTDIDKPEVLAVRGVKGVVEGVDYRGTSVVAALVAIPGSPWFIVARIDKDEVIAPVRQRFWVMVIAISGILGLTFSGMIFLWRRRYDLLIRERLKADEALRESEEFTRTILDNLPIGIAVNSIGSDITFQYMNNSFLYLYRTSREDLIKDNNFWTAVYEEPGFREKLMQRVLHDCESGDPERMFWPDIPICRKGEETTYISARNIPLKNKGMMISTVWDVTDRIKAEEKLKKSEYRYRSLFDHAPDAIFVNFEDRIIIVNNACVNLFGGHSPGNILNRSIYDFFHPDYHENIRNRISIMRSSVEPVPPIEEKIISLDGKIIDVEVTAAPFSYNEAQAIHVILRDITVRKTMEEELYNSEKRLRSMLDTMMEGCQIIGFDWNYIYLNDASDRHNRRPKEELLGKNYMEMWPGIEETGVFRDIRHCLEDRVAHHLENEFIFQDGTARSFDLSILPVPEGVFILSIDITERKQAEQELQINYSIQRVLNEILSISMNKAPLNDMLQKSLIALLSLDWLSFESRGMIALYDKEQDTTKLVAHCGLSEHILEQLKSDNWIIKDCPCKPAITSGKLMLVKGEDLRDTVFFDTADSHDHYCVPILNDGEVLGVINLFIEDGHLYNDWEADFLKAVSTTLAGTITRRNAEVSLSGLNEELESRIIERTEDLAVANKELESFSYTVSHDLRAPLRHINGFLEMLVKEIGVTKSEKTNHYIDVIKESSIRMGNLIDDLLSFSRMGRINLSITPLDINEIFEEALSDYNDLIDERNIKISRSPLLMAYGDKTMLRLVLSNLVSNAIKFTTKKEAPEIIIGSEIRENENIYFVKDNGAGFDMQFADKLFGVFQRLHSDNDFEGTGIGLATIKRIINRHGGRVWADSKPGEGSVFYFTLPAPETNNITVQSEGNANE